MNVARCVLRGVVLTGLCACGGQASSQGQAPGAPASGVEAGVEASGVEAGPPCSPATCQDDGVACGTASDGCGHLLACGTCPSPQFCGGAGRGQCGGDVTMASDAAGVTAVAISAGLYSTCALFSNGTVRCWGYNAYGQLGDGTLDNSAKPVVVQGLTGATALAAWSGYHACALLGSGSAQCWGSNLYGDFGNGTAVDSQTIKTVLDLDDIAHVSAGDNDTCAALASGTAWCWGEDAYGSLGTGSGSLTPVQVPGLSDVVWIEATSSTCALLADGTVDCWGDNGSGQIGNGAIASVLDPVYTPTPVAGLSGVTAIAGGIADECAIVAGGAVLCWGDNSHGQIGDGTVTSSGVATPTVVPGLIGVTALALNGGYACALLADGTVDCWGDNEDGTLGNGTTTDSSTPVAVPGLTDVVAISAGTEHACALLAGGAVECWGLDNEDQLGQAPVSETCGASACSTTPVPVAW